MKEWYAIRVVSGQEKKITQLIESMTEEGEFPMEVGEVHIPTELVVSNRKGKQYSQKRRLLPGYIMVEVDLPQVGWRNAVTSLRSIDGVIGFANAVSVGEKPESLSEEEARGMLAFGRDSASGTVQATRIRQVYAVGESINITHGPFSGFGGTVESVDDEKTMVHVTVEIFGRAIQIDLSFDHVEKI